MQFSASVVVLFSLLPAVFAAPAATSAKGTSKAAAGKTSSSASAAGATSSAAAGGASGAATTVSEKQVSNAVMSWMNDTGKVTNFLNTATSFSGDEFTKQATIALNAEKDELNHKNVLDTGFGTQAAVQAANDTLATQGTFQAVVDALQSMVNDGPDTAQAQVDAINANRCVNVLPNIDAYFAAAGMPQVSAVRPSGCLDVPGAAATQPPAAGDAGASSAAGSIDASTTSAAKAGATSKAAKGTVAAAGGAAGGAAKASAAPADAATDASGEGASAADATSAAKPAAKTTKAAGSVAAAGAAGKATRVSTAKAKAT